MKQRHKRMVFFIAVVIAAGLAAWLILKSFRNNLVFFFTPTEVKNGVAPSDQDFRIGGLVKTGSLERSNQDMQVRFIVTDNLNNISISYSGILPDLFKEGKGVVVQGHQNANGEFEASQVLAKHDENYMPPEAAEALKQTKSLHEITGSTLINSEK